MSSCNACLGLHPYGRPKHYKCALNGCSCSCSMNHFSHPLDAGEVKVVRKAQKLKEKVLRPSRPTVAGKPVRHYTGGNGKRFFADSEKSEITSGDIPKSVKIRNGRWMTEEQKQWIFILREDNWKIEDIANLIGFCHTAVVAQLKKRKRQRSVLSGETKVYTDFYEPESAAS